MESCARKTLRLPRIGSVFVYLEEMKPWGPLKNLEQQIDLENGGQLLDNEEEAKLYLLDNNYYNIINMS